MDTPVVVFPYAVAVAIAGLTDGRANQGWDEEGPISGDVPRPRPTQFTTVRDTGGHRRDLVTDEAQLTIDSWAPNKTAAHDLAQRNRALFHALRSKVVDGTTVYRTGELGRPVRLPDDESDQERYRHTVTIALRGTAP